MPLFKAAIITENDHDGQTPPNDFTGRMLGVDVVNGITEPEKWRDIRRFAAKGFVTGEADSEKMNRLERLAKHGPMPRLPTEEEVEALDVPEEFADVAPPHNERVSLMKEEGFNPYEVTSHPNKAETLALFWVFEKGSEVLDELDLPEEEEPSKEDTEEEESSGGDNASEETLADDSPPTKATVDEDGEVTIEEKADEGHGADAPEEGEEKSSGEVDEEPKTSDEDVEDDDE